MAEKKAYEPLNMEIKWENVDTNSDLFDFPTQLAKAIQEKYDAFFATQMTLIAKEKGVSVADLCLRHNDITANYQKIDGDIKFWVEVK